MTLLATRGFHAELPRRVEGSRLAGWFWMSAACGAGLLLAAGLAGVGSDPAPTGLPDPGAITRRGLPVARFLSDICAVGAVGVLLLCLLLPASAGTVSAGRLLRPAGRWLAGWLAASLGGLLLLWSEVTAVPAWRLRPGSLDELLALPPARALLVTVLLVAAVGAAAPRVRTRAGLLGLLLTALAALLPPLLTGHAIHRGQGLPTAFALTVHVVAATLWAGGLLAVCLHLRVPTDVVYVVARRFSRVALPCSLALAASGLAVAVTRGALSWDTGYGRLLAAKATLLVLLLCLGGRQRLRALPLLAAGRPGLFVRVCLIEAGLLVGALTLAAVLSTTPVT